MSKVIGVGDLSAAVAEILEEYGDRATEVLRTETPKAAKAAARELRAASPSRFGGYAKSWTARCEEQPNGASGIVHNRKYPGLAHLLEHGHALRNGGRSRAIVHIAPVNEQAQQDFLTAVRKGLEGIS